MFLSAATVPEKYIGPAREFARLLVKHNFNLVWGGSDSGLMKIVSDEVQQQGGKVIGITMEMLKDVAKKGADEMIITADFSARKKMMLERSDAFVVMVGGIGTLDEVTELLELKKHNLHQKPIIFLNTANFYSGLKTQMEKMENEGFLSKKLSDFVRFADTPEEVFNYLKS